MFGAFLAMAHAVRSTLPIPVNDLARAAHADERLPALITEVISSGRYILGHAVASFEREFADYCGVRHCIGVGNGSDALELALRAVGIGPGDEVLTVANAGMYSTLAILALGAVPRYVDVDAVSLTTTAGLVAEAVTSRTRAVVVTHLYGRLADIGAISLIARDAGLPLIEDAAQAHGAGTAAKRAGSFGTIGCFSFYPTKNLGALGDGGALTTDDDGLNVRLRSLRQHGWREKYKVTEVGGRNSRLDEIQAAVLRSRLPHLDTANARRRAIAERYGVGLRHELIRTPILAGLEDVVHLYVVRTAQREALRSHLASRGVNTDVHYPVPDHRQPIVSTDIFDSLPVTEQACREVVTLPCFPELTDAEVDHVIDSCNTWTP